MLPPATTYTAPTRLAVAAIADVNGKVTQYFQPVCGQRLGAAVPHKKDMAQMGELFDRAILSGTPGDLWAMWAVAATPRQER